jgi:hypothetical protein
LYEPYALTVLPAANNSLFGLQLRT